MLNRKPLFPLRILVTVCCFWCALQPVFAQGIERQPPPAVLKALDSAQIPLNSVAIVVHPLHTPTRPNTPDLLAIHADQAMNPASVMKLVSTYAALHLKGPNGRWVTQALSDAPLTSGTLSGNLFLKGSGDPKFAQEQLTALFRQLRARGIETISGDILIDREAFKLPPSDPKPFDDAPMRPYNVGPDAFLLNFHAINLSFQPTLDKIDVFLETPATGLSIDNQLKPARNSRCDDWKEQIIPRLSGKRGAWVLKLEGIYPVSCGARPLNLAPFDGDAYAPILIPALWQELGGTLLGNVQSGKTSTSATLLAEQESAPISEIVRDINKFSNNVMARQLFLSLSENFPATLEEARSRTRHWLDQNQLHFPELVLDNGSGLSRQERMSARSLSRLLVHAWNSPVMPEFMASLPVVGVDGTMRKRLQGSPSQGRAHIKTGTLSGVKTMAGYALNQRGERWIVVMLINHPNAQQGQAAMDALLRWVIERS